MTHPAGNFVSGTQTLQRAAALLRTISSANRSGLRLTDLLTMIRVERATMHRILQGLVSEGLLTQDHRTRRYFLGPLAYEMGIAASTRFEIGRVSQRHLQAVADATGDTVFLTIRSGLDGLCVERKEGAYPVKAFVLNVGQRRPLGIGAGSVALLAALPVEDANRIIRSNADRFAGFASPRTVADVTREVTAARECGFAHHNIQEIRGICAIGVAIADTHGEIQGAISVSGLAIRLRGRHQQAALTAIRAAAAAVSAELAHL